MHKEGLIHATCHRRRYRRHLERGWHKVRLGEGMVGDSKGEGILQGHAVWADDIKETGIAHIW